MSKKSWNTFTEEHPEAFCFGAAVSSRLPKGLNLDRAGKKLPTPYGLFLRMGERLILPGGSGRTLTIEVADIYQIAKNCRTSVEMIEKFYASHFRMVIRTEAVNRRSPRKSTGKLAKNKRGRSQQKSG